MSKIKKLDEQERQRMINFVLKRNQKSFVPRNFSWIEANEYNNNNKKIKNARSYQRLFTI